MMLFPIKHILQYLIFFVRVNFDYQEVFRIVMHLIIYLLFFYKICIITGVYEKIGSTIDPCSLTNVFALSRLELPENKIDLWLMLIIK